MRIHERSASQRYRLWIGHCGNWRPKSWDDLPRESVALELADEGCFSAEEAAAFVEGFNSRMLLESHPRWAIAVPVQVHYEGDLRPGQTVLPGSLARWRPVAQRAG